MIFWLLRTLRGRGQLFDLLYDVKWLVGVALVSAVVFAIPGQLLEIYRILVEDGGWIGLFSAIAAIGLAIWLCTEIVCFGSLRRFGPVRPGARHLARTLPMALAVLPALGCSLGMFLSRPSLLPPEAMLEYLEPTSPWRDIADLLTQSLRTGLAKMALVLLLLITLVSLWVGYFLAGWVRRLRPQLFRWFRSRAAIGLSLAVIAVAVAAFAYDPARASTLLGLFGTIALFFVALTVLTTQLSLLAMQLRFPFVAVLLVAALVFSLVDLNDNHHIRLLDADAVAAPTARDQFLAWYKARPDHQSFNKEYPVYIIAAQGGGIYAAYQAALFLARMEDTCPGFRDHLFAISSVSGGSLGAATFTAMLSHKSQAGAQKDNPATGGDQTGAAGRPCGRGGSATLNGPIEAGVTKILSEDFLTPLIGATLFPDFLQRFLPIRVPYFDRARALEASFEAAAENTRGQGRSPFGKGFLEQWNPLGSKPALIMNATDVSSGRRFLISPFRLESEPPQPPAQPRCNDEKELYFPFWKPAYVDYRSTPPASQENEAWNLRLSTAVGVSARFPWVLPAAAIDLCDPYDGKIRKTRLVDGGYVDNSGVETALDLVEALEPALEEINSESFSESLPPHEHVRHRPARLIVIVLTGGDRPHRGSYGAGETLEPLRALLSIRVSRSFFAIDRASKIMAIRSFPGIPDENGRNPLLLSDLRRARLANDFYELPLGWRLGSDTRRIIQVQSGNYADCGADRNFEQTLPRLSNADCIQLLVRNDLTENVESAADEIAAMNYHLPDALRPKSKFREIDPRKLLECARPRAYPPKNLLQSRLLKSFFDEFTQRWEARPDLSDRRILAYALATADWETAGFSAFRELGGKERLERLYGERTRMGRLLGNTQPGDGVRFAGRGLIQLTGRANYRRVGQAIGIGNNLELYPELLVNPEVSSFSAFDWMFKLSAPRFVQAILREDWVSARRVINGDKVGIEGVQRRYPVYLNCLRNAGTEKGPPTSVGTNVKM